MRTRLIRWAAPPLIRRTTVLALLVALALVAATAQPTSAPFTDRADVPIELRGAELPVYVPGLVLWLDAADADTRFADVAGSTPAGLGSTLARWDDKSPVGNDASQAALAARPMISGDGPVFDGDDRLALDPSLLPTGSDPSTTFVVARLASGHSGDAVAFSHGGTAVGAGTRTFGNSGFRSRSVAGATSASWPSAAAGLLSGRYGLAGGIEARADGGSPSSDGTAFLTTPDQATVGALGTDVHWSGSILEILVFDRVLSDAEHRTLEEHLAAKWSIALTPDAVAAPAVTPTASGTLRLSWSAPGSSGTTAVSDYLVQRRLVGAPTWTTVVDGFSAMTSATVSGLTVGSTYEFRLAAVNDTGAGPWSPVVSALALGAWTPAELSGGLELWLDGDAASTLTAPGGVVSEWRDRSGNGRHTTQATVGARPVTATDTASGRTVVRFANPSGLAQWLDLPPLAAIGTATMISVQRSNSDPAWLLLNQDLARHSFAASSTSTTTGLTSGFGNPTHVANGTNATWTRRTDIHEQIGNGPSIVAAVGASFSTWSGTARLAGYGGGWSFHGDVPELIVASGSLGTVDRQLVEGYLAHKWALTDLLPGTHPYRDLPPLTAAPATAPGAPTALTVTPGDSSATLSWTAPVGSTTPVRDYVVEHRIAGSSDAWTTVADGVGTATTATITGVANGTGLEVRVAAVSAAGTGAWATGTTTPVGPPGAPTGLAADRMLVTTVAGSGASSFADGTGTAAAFSGLRGIARDAAGNLYVAERNNHRIRRISPAGVVTTHAGNGTTAVLNDPYGVAVAPDGTVYVAEFNGHRIRRIDVNGTVTTLAGSGAAGSTDGTGTAASFNNPTNLVLDAAGNLYVAEFGGHRIRRITPSGVVTTLAGSGVAGTADGTGTAASFNGPTGLRFDALGNLYVTDQISGLVRRVTPGGVVTTVPGGTGFSTPLGVEVDAVGNLYVSEWGGHRIRRITPAGGVSVVAGTGTSAGANGPGTAATFASPAGILLEPDGALLVTEGGGNRVRRVTPVGSGSLAVAWTAPTATGGSPITDYLVEYRPAPSGAWTAFDDGVSTATSTTITGLTDGVAYDVRVSAVNAVGTGSPSAVVTRTPSWTPAAPTGLTLTPGLGSLEATWTAPADTGGNAITDYLVEYRTSPSGPWTVVPDGISTATSATITGLTATETYDVRVTAGNANGPGVPTTATATVPTGSAWTPSDLTSGPVLWLDASDTTSLALNGSSVSRWTDRGGRTIHAEQATATAQPTRVDGAMNGLPVLRFDGGDWFQIAHDASLEPGNNLTFVAVVRMDVTSGRYSIYHAADDNQAGHFWIEGGTGGVYPVGYSVAVPNFFQSSASVTASPAADLVVYRRNGVGATHSWRVAGQTRTALAPTTDQPYVASSRPKMVGARYTTGAQGFVGDMAELLLIPATLSDADAALLEGYLAHKWGLTGSLPADHPYKTAAPQSPRPSEPTAVTATPGAQQLTVTWNAPTIAGTTAVSDYVVQYRTAPSGTWATFTDGISTATTTTITGLADGTTYDIRVAAVNAMGMGPWSPSTTATTQVPAYGAAVTATGPLAYWRFGSEGGGVVPLAAGGGASFPMAACTPIAQTTSPFAGSAVGLTGASYGFTAPSMVTSGPFTVEFWYRPTAHNPVPISFSRSGGMMSLYHSSANWFGFNVGTGDVYGAAAPALNEWTHVVARFPNGPLSEARLFLNGVEQTLSQRQGSTPATYPTATTTAWFGSFGAGNHVVAGHLGELAFYPASVDPSSVAAHASITDAAAYRAAVAASGPASYWRFDRHAAAAVPLAAGASGSFPLTTTCRVRTLSPFANAWFGLVGMSHAFTAPNDVATGPFTAEFWMRPTAYGGAPLSFGTGAAGSTPALLLDANGFGFTSGSGDVWGAPAPALNTWTHVVARFPNGDRSGARLFLNGVEQTLTQRVGSTPVTMPTAATAARFGALADTTNVFAGTLAELAVYPAAVDPAVVAAHAAATGP